MFSKPVPPGRSRPEAELRYCLLPGVEMPALTTVSTLSRSTITTTTISPSTRPALLPPGGNRQPEHGAQSPAPAASLRTHLNVQIHVSSQPPPRGQARRAPSPDARRRRAPTPGGPPAPAHAPRAPATPPAFRPPPAHSGPPFGAPPAHAATFRAAAGLQVRFPRPAAPPPAHVHAQARGPPVYVQPLTPSPVMSIVLSGPPQGYGRPPPCCLNQPPFGYQAPAEPFGRNFGYADAPPPYAGPGGDGFRRVNRPPPQPQFVRPQPFYAAGMQYPANPNNNGQIISAPQNVTYGVPMIGTWRPAYFTSYVPPPNGAYAPYLGGPSWQNSAPLSNAPSGPAPPHAQQGHVPVAADVALPPGAPSGFQNHGGPSNQQPSAQYPLPPSQSGTANFDSAPYLNPGNTSHPQEPICTCSFYTVNGQLQSGVDHYFFPPVSNPARIDDTVNDDVTVNDVNCYMAQAMQDQLDDPYKYICEYAEQEGPGDYGRSFDLEQHLDNFCNNLQCYHNMFQARNTAASDDTAEQQGGENLTPPTSSEQSPALAIDDELTGRIVNDALDVLNDPPENEVSSSGIDLAE